MMLDLMLLSVLMVTPKMRELNGIISSVITLFMGFFGGGGTTDSNRESA
jgi:hypothetical protein